MRAMNLPDTIAHLRTALTALLAQARACAALADVANVVQAAERFVDSFAVSAPPGAGFKHIPSPAHTLHGEMLGRHGSETASAFLFLCLLIALDRTLASDRLLRLPPRISAHQLRHFERMVGDPEPTMQSCDLHKDLFLKEFGLASLRLYAGGSNLIDANSGVGRSLLWKNGLADLPRRLAILMRMGGFRPFFEIHAHQFYMAEFTPEGREECYRCCSELYALHPEVRGMIAGSWFYDPAVAGISPHLAYLREVPEHGGAYVLFDSFSAGAARDALATSRSRRTLAQAGRYRPAAYTLLWPRARQIAWAVQGVGGVA